MSEFNERNENYNENKDINKNTNTSENTDEMVNVMETANENEHEKANDNLDMRCSSENEEVAPVREANDYGSADTTENYGEDTIASDSSSENIKDEVLKEDTTYPMNSAPYSQIPMQQTEQYVGVPGSEQNVQQPAHVYGERASIRYDLDKTSKDGNYTWQYYNNESQTPPAPKKKHTVLKVLASVAASVMLVGVGVFSALLATNYFAPKAPASDVQQENDVKTDDTGSKSGSDSKNTGDKSGSVRQENDNVNDEAGNTSENGPKNNKNTQSDNIKYKS